MTLQHRVLRLWKVRQVLTHGSNTTAPQLGFKTFFSLKCSRGNLWRRNVIFWPPVPGGLRRMVHTGVAPETSGLMQRNRHFDGNQGDRINPDNEKDPRLSLPSGLITNTPQSIQVFADPSLTKCVRDLASDMQKVKTTLKFNKEEVADCVYEYIRLNNSYDSLKSDVKETSKLAKELVKETEGNAKTFTDKHKELEKCLLYFTEKTVAHENQMRDITKQQEQIVDRMEEFVTNLDCLIDEVTEVKECVHGELKPEVEGIMGLSKLLGADDGSLQVDVKKITEDLARIKSILNDGDWIEAEGCNKPKIVDSEGAGEGCHKK